MKIPFSKNEHIRTIHDIAVGLQRAGFLKRYLEIGIKKGSCFNQIAPLCKEAYAVDILNCKKLIKQNKNLFWFHGKSEDFLKQHPVDKKFDLVFIDGAHEHKASLNDFKLVFPLVNDNGIILLHDTYPPSEKFTSKSYCHDTYKTAEYIMKYYSHYEFVTLPFSYGISIFRKLDRQLLWKK
jgi:hypothetical protein